MALPQAVIAVPRFQLARSNSSGRFSRSWGWISPPASREPSTYGNCASENPDFCFEKLRWTEFHPLETFRFWQVKVRVGNASPESGWIYQPDPATKALHEQPPEFVEVLAPPLGELAVGSVIDLGIDPTRISLIGGQGRPDTP